MKKSVFPKSSINNSRPFLKTNYRLAGKAEPFLKRSIVGVTRLRPAFSTAVATHLWTMGTRHRCIGALGRKERCAQSAQGEDCLKRLFSPVATHLLDGRVPRIGVAWKKACVSKE